MLLRHVLARAALDIVIKTQLATICLTPGASAAKGGSLREARELTPESVGKLSVCGTAV
jgi:hypothetical protein